MNGLSTFCPGLERVGLSLPGSPFNANFPFTISTHQGRIEGSCLRTRRRDHLESVTFWDFWSLDRDPLKIDIGGPVKVSWPPFVTFSLLFLPLCHYRSETRRGPSIPFKRPLYAPEGSSYLNAGFSFYGNSDLFTPFSLSFLPAKIKVDFRN